MRVSAPAKINLTLEVTGVEANGYHTLDTLFVWLDLNDDLELERADRTSLVLAAEGVSTESVTTDGENLVLKAHAALEKVCQKALPTKFSLTKRIPAGGGLGGGSADAAAALVGVNQLYDLGLTQAQLLEVGRGLGADVSFGLVGGMARGTHYGDRLTPLSLERELLEARVCLVLPGLFCPTPTVYKDWDKSPVHVARGATERFLQAATPARKYREIANDLEEPALRLYPSLRSIKKKMQSLGLEGVCLSGSGSTFFGFVPPDADLERIEREFAALEARVVITKLREEVRFELVT